MPKLFLLFSHKLTPTQIQDLDQTLQIAKTDLHRLPANLQLQWTKVPPTKSLKMENYLQPIITWLKRTISPNDYLLIQGEPGAVVYMVQYAHHNNWIPIYATTKRMVKEEKLTTGEIKKVSIFKHVAFRRYEQVL